MNTSALPCQRTRRGDKKEQAEDRYLNTNENAKVDDGPSGFGGRAICDESDQKEQHEN